MDFPSSQSILALLREKEIPVNLQVLAAIQVLKIENDFDPMRFLHGVRPLLLSIREVLTSCSKTKLCVANLEEYEHLEGCHKWVEPMNLMGIYSCQEPQEPQGPQGCQGPLGPRGLQGPLGPARFTRVLEDRAGATIP